MRITLDLLPEEALAAAAFLDSQRSSRRALAWSPTLRRSLEYLAGKLRHNAAIAGAGIETPARLCEICGLPGALRFRADPSLPAATHHARCRATLLLDKGRRPAGRVP